jgi:hypothetical protein
MTLQDALLRDRIFSLPATSLFRKLFLAALA